MTPSFFIWRPHAHISLHCPGANVWLVGCCVQDDEEEEDTGRVRRLKRNRFIDDIAAVDEDEEEEEEDVSCYLYPQALS